MNSRGGFYVFAKVFEGFDYVFVGGLSDIRRV